MPKARNALALWFPAAAVVIVSAVSLYVVAQHIQRTTANDPQYELARDAAADLILGEEPALVVTGVPVDITQSLAPFTVIYDTEGDVLATNATGVEEDFLTPPLEMLNEARSDGINEVTWQPRKDLRYASVIQHWRGELGEGTVLVARSLELVEKRATQTLSLAFVALVIGLIIAALGALAGAWVLEQRWRDQIA